MTTLSIEQNILYKTCSKCGEEKPIDAYYRSRSNKDGRFGCCKKCKNTQQSDYFKANREKIYAYTRRWNKENREKANGYCRKWCRENPEAIKVASQKPERIAKKKISSRAWAIANRNKVIEYDKKRRSTPHGRIDDAMSSGIRQALKREKGNTNWCELVGYTAQELKKHLERLFKDGMSWENYGDWHIDHIIPKAVFNYAKPEHEDFKRCWDMKNLRPLWAAANISKHAKLKVPFQPRLAMG